MNFKEGSIVYHVISNEKFIVLEESMGMIMVRAYNPWAVSVFSRYDIIKFNECELVLKND